MKLKDLSITFHTDKIKECIDFYSKYFGATVAFDADWYVMIRLESDIPLFLSFQGHNGEMNRPQFGGGVTLNLSVEDVDVCYNQLKPLNLSFVEKITDHEWGDRAFSLLDPIGNLVYVYSERPIADKYKDAVKK
ncbi:MAG: VOC family protein [Bacteroidales bacterium]|jgi:uncharacterized glyoxalase superfamily protein PhnB|nr:VOC family protein [Bacteroidales bacterium]